MNTLAFDTDKYYNAQMERFMVRLDNGSEQVIEFGGKPFGDYHAARVLPGYNPDVKASILRDLTQELGDVTMVMSLHAQDVLSSPDGRRIATRVRGDTGLYYDDEVIRLADQARTAFGLPLDTVAITALPVNLSTQNRDYVESYSSRLVAEGLKVKTISYIEGYPLLDVNTIEQTLTQNDSVSDTDHVIIVSPGGGSGKFCVAITEIAHRLKAGKNPNFIKFETFPVFTLPPSHPLNVAFLAATADLPNTLVTTGQGQTNYDKDVQNLAILKALIVHYPGLDSPLDSFIEPTDWGVNAITEGIIDPGVIAEECLKEIVRRIARYQKEQSVGKEREETVYRSQQYLGSLTMPRSAMPKTQA